MRSQKSQKPAPAIIGRGCDSEGRRVFSVASRSEKDAAYTVTVHEHVLSCTCYAGQYRPETPCCHRKAVHELLVAERDAQAKRVAVASGRQTTDTAPLYRSNAAFSIFASER